VSLRNRQYANDNVAVLNASVDRTHAFWRHLHPRRTLRSAEGLVNVSRYPLLLEEKQGQNYLQNRSDPVSP
jgi:hypothetical protein